MIVDFLLVLCFLIFAALLALAGACAAMFMDDTDWSGE